HLAAKQYTAAEAAREGGELLRVARLGDAAERLSVDRLVLEIVSDGVRQRGEPTDRARERIQRHSPSLRAFGREVLDAIEQRSDTVARESVDARVRLAFGDGDEVQRVIRLPHAGLTEQTACIRHHHVAVPRVGRYAVDQDHQRKASLLTGTEDLPRNEIRVAARRRHEDAQVTGLEQHVSELAVIALDRVDVG